MCSSFFHKWGLYPHVGPIVDLKKIICFEPIEIIAHLECVWAQEVGFVYLTKAGDTLNY